MRSSFLKTEIKHYVNKRKKAIKLKEKYWSNKVTHQRNTTTECNLNHREVMVFTVP